MERKERCERKKIPASHAASPRQLLPNRFLRLQIPGAQPQPLRTGDTLSSQRGAEGGPPPRVATTWSPAGRAAGEESSQLPRIQRVQIGFLCF